MSRTLAQLRQELGLLAELVAIAGAKRIEALGNVDRWARELAPSDELRRWFDQQLTRRGPADGPATLLLVTLG